MQRERIDRRITRLLPTGGVFVDLGCGDGWALDELQPYYEQAIGLDNSLARMRARAHPIGGWRFVEADLNEPLPLPSDYARAALANQVIEHIADPERFVCETYRILQPGGVFVATTPNIRYAKHLVRLIVLGEGPSTSSRGVTIDGPWDDGHLHYFTHKDLRRLLTEAGFTNVQSRALIDTSDGSWCRRALDSASSTVLVREFASGNILMRAAKPHS